MSVNNIININSLDKYQLQVVKSDTNLLVIAGAGSGKTLTIISKINYLIENCICSEKEILVISFTNASVNDLKKRINYNVDVFTFHKLAMQILQLNNIEYNICSSSLLEYIIMECLHCASTDEQKTILRFLKLNISYNKFVKSANFKSFCNLITTFINLYKANNIHKEQIIKANYSKNEIKIILIVFKIYHCYLQEKKSTNSLDFDDLIKYATFFASKTIIDYKYIIIDEFQDTSLIRLNLIKEIYNHTNSKIIVVGDDYQSIYNFSGCDLGIFLNFNKLFSNVKVIKLKYTYRNSLNLVNIASKFIIKNPVQIKKDLYAFKECKNPIILVPYINKIDALKETINQLLSITDDIMILSRNNNDIYSYIDNDYKLNDNFLIYKNLKLRYYTVHKSKGLEAEYVIIINCNNDYLGFPNKIENSQIIKKLLPNNEIKYAEERRLFYVAITRCKEKTFIIYQKNNPSIFVKEIKKITRKLY